MKLFFRQYGEGPPLIIIHGLFGSSDNWMTIAGKAGKYFTVYLPDMRNHGSSPHSSRHDYESMRDDIFELTQRLGINRLFIAGHSMGGRTAIQFALKWPEKLYGLIIADISPFTSADQDKSNHKLYKSILETMQSVDLKKVSSRNEVEMIIGEKISSERIRGFILKNLKRETDNTFRWKLNTDALLKNLPLMMEGMPRPSADYSGITGFPVVFLKGENSEYLPDKDMPDIRKLFPGAELVTVRGAGHWVHSDNPEEVAAALLTLRTGR